MVVAVAAQTVRTQRVDTIKRVGFSFWGHKISILRLLVQIAGVHFVAVSF